MKLSQITSLVLSFVFLNHLPAFSAEFTLERDAEGITVNLDGQLFTRYLIASGAKPILWPIIGPTGAEVTRGYPMREATGDERSDHIHHRSFWFTHGDVNGVSFWHEDARHGVTKHREFVETVGGEQARIVTRNDWIDSDDVKQCWDERALTFGTSGDNRWIDFDITIHAFDRPVKFGDTKEGTFGIRVAGSMKVEAEKGGKIVNGAGETDKDTWGKPASWVDYHGPVGNEVVGIAIMNHPTSFRFPTHWHVRTYGLFAANVFGLRNFQNSNDIDGSHTLAPEDSITFRYRVFVHRGDEIQGHVAEAFAEYVSVKKTDS